MIINRKEDLHIHCNYNDHSDVDLTIPNVIKRAEDLKLERIAFTEHVRKSSEWTRKYLNELDQYSQMTNIQVLKGFEAKILPDGSIDCPDEFISDDYFIIASFHKKYDKQIWLNSLLKAIKNPCVNVIGHLAPEAEFTIDDEQIYNIGKSLIENNKIIEINAKYIRPPLNFLEIFIKLGVKFHVGSDAHRLEDIGDFNRIMHLINLIEK